MSTLEEWATTGRRPKACLSDFALERIHHGELTESEARTRAHLATCPTCNARLATLAVKRAPALDIDRLVERAPGVPSAGSAPLRRSWRRLAVGTLVGAAAAAACAALLVGGTSVLDQRTKGDAWHLGVIVQRPNGRTERVASGDTLRPGDRIQFEIGAQRDGFIAIVSLDSAGAVTAFYPTEGSAVSVTAHRRQLSTRSVILDDVLGPEHLILAGCAQPFSVQALVKAAQEQFARANHQPRRVEKLEFPCDQTSIWINKAP